MSEKTTDLQEEELLAPDNLSTDEGLTIDPPLSVFPMITVPGDQGTAIYQRDGEELTDEILHQESLKMETKLRRIDFRPCSYCNVIQDFDWQREARISAESFGIFDGVPGVERDYTQPQVIYYGHYTILKNERVKFYDKPSLEDSTVLYTLTDTDVPIKSGGLKVHEIDVRVDDDGIIHPKWGSECTCSSGYLDNPAWGRVTLNKQRMYVQKDDLVFIESRQETVHTQSKKEIEAIKKAASRSQAYKDSGIKPATPPIKVISPEDINVNVDSIVDPGSKWGMKEVLDDRETGR